MENVFIFRKHTKYWEIRGFQAAAYSQMVQEKKLTQIINLWLFKKKKHNVLQGPSLLVHLK